jgi:hypothetical protein
MELDTQCKGCKLLLFKKENKKVQRKLGMDIIRQSAAWVLVS